MNDVLHKPWFLLAVYGTAIFFLTYSTRKIVETAKPELKKQADANDAKISYKSTGARWWNEVVLYSLGPFFGVVLAFSLRETEYFPAMFKANYALTAMAGICVGFTCGWFFKIFKKFVSRTTGVENLDSTVDVPKPPGGE